jgi:hypothetical protein
METIQMIESDFILVDPISLVNLVDQVNLNYFLILFMMGCGFSLLCCNYRYSNNIKYKIVPTEPKTVKGEIIESV